MKKILLYSTGGFGDALVFTHLATLLQQRLLDVHVDFCINHDFAFQFGNGNNKDAVEILKLQRNIADVCILDKNTGILKFSDGKFVDIKESSPYDKVYVQQEFYTDLGYVKSLFIEFIKEYGMVPNIGETQFRVNSTPAGKKPLNEIAVPGEQDWKNKWKGQEAKVEALYAELIKRGYKLNVIGPENGKTYLENLQLLQSFRLYIGPFGSIGHCAAGLGVNTITLSGIFSPYWDNPEYYHSGFHKGIICKPQFHCGNYACMTPKLYSQPKNNAKVPGPPLIEGNSPWAEKCNYTPDRQSCVSSVTVDEFIVALDEWEERVDYKNSKI